MPVKIPFSVEVGQTDFSNPALAELSEFSGRAALRTSYITMLETEYADAGMGAKMVFSGQREDGSVATFETGSFYDKGGDSRAPNKHDICVSTAGGCTRNCHFCSVPSAELGFERLLTADEIIFQAMYAMAIRNAKNVLPNVLGIMGNGEPADNVALRPALDYLVDTGLIDRVTISTIGEHTHNIGALARRFADSDVPVKLQFSLHAADESNRRLIIPGRTPLNKALEAVDNYAEVTGIPVKHNVVLMDGTGAFDGFTNASPEDAKQLADLLNAPSRASGEPLVRRLKLSAYNPVPNLPFTTPSEEARAAFVDTLHEEGVTDIKTFRGSGIDIDPANGTGGFACGQLRATTARLSITAKR